MNIRRYVLWTLYVVEESECTIYRQGELEGNPLAFFVRVCNPFEIALPKTNLTGIPDRNTNIVISSLYVCMVNIQLKCNFVETPRKFIIAQSVRSVSSDNNALSLALMKIRADGSIALR